MPSSPSLVCPPVFSIYIGERVGGEVGSAGGFGGGARPTSRPMGSTSLRPAPRSGEVTTQLPVIGFLCSQLIRLYDCVVVCSARRSPPAYTYPLVLFPCGLISSIT